MPSLENLKKRAKELVRQHRERFYPVAHRIRSVLPRFRDCDDKSILDTKFRLAEAQELIAREHGFENWQGLRKGIRDMPEEKQTTNAAPKLIGAFPQLHVTDIFREVDFFKTLGFEVGYLWGDPPYYGLVVRDGARITIRHVDRLAIDEEMRDKEKLLSAVLPVENVKSLYGEYVASGIDFVQTLKLQPWRAEDFIVADPDGNLICFVTAL